jgi:hypothetical protein
MMDIILMIPAMIDIDDTNHDRYNGIQIAFPSHLTDALLCVGLSPTTSIQTLTVTNLVKNVDPFPLMTICFPHGASSVQPDSPNVQLSPIF